MERKQTINYQLYLLDKEFKYSSNLDKYIDEAQAFYNGKQYANENYGNMIRVQLNICSFASNIKASKIVGTPIYIRYTSDNDNVDCTALQRFDEYNISKLNEKTENFQSALNGFNNGTEIIYYRWDEDDSSYKGIYKGGLVLEHIDPRKFAVPNPYIADIQNQKWVMFWKDEEVGAIRDLVEDSNETIRKEKQKRILPDDFAARADYYEKNHDSINHSLVRVYTRFFRINGEVYFMASTSEVDLFEYPHALNPEVNKKIIKAIIKKYNEQQDNPNSNDETLEKIKDYAIDYEDVVMQLTNIKKFNDKEFSITKEKFSLYPFAVYIPFNINGSFYGRSDVKSLIPIQKGLNFIIDMMLMCAQNNAYNKIFAKEDALQGQEITNEPGQLIVDYSKFTNGWGIKFAESQPMPNGMTDFAERLLGLTRIIYGFNDVMDGSISNQDISGYAIQQMIKQANSSIEQQQQLFWKFCKDKAAIRLMFYKFFVDEAKYTYEREDYEIDKEEISRAKLKYRQKQLQEEGKQLEIGDVNLSTPTKKVRIASFERKDIYGSNFDINIDVMQGLVDSKLAESQMWDTLILNGGIQNMEPEMLEMYIHANPTVSEHTKHALKAVIEKQKQSENYQLKQKLTQASEYLQQITNYAKELEAQNGYKKNYIDNLTKEFENKINVANKYINNLNKQKVNFNNLSATEPISDGQIKSMNAKGISSSDNTK